MAEPPDIHSVPCDLNPPAVAAGPPAAGRRVWAALPRYANDALRHTLYLPPEWTAKRQWPLLVEFPGNGPFRNAYGDDSSGRPEDVVMGYGLSDGAGCLWLCLPFVDSQRRAHQCNWWGDAQATAEYAVEAVEDVCARYQADPGRVILCGFSRGAIACSYIGLRTDRVARLWRGFFSYSHFDGERTWPHADSDRASAYRRLARLQDRPWLVSHEVSVESIQRFAAAGPVDGQFTWLPVGFRNHNAGWLLRNVPERAIARRWLADLLVSRT